MVNGNPYISTKSATIKAEKAPKVHQSLEVLGLKKLKANIIKMAELSTTKSHEP
jgi:hypothetical protein